MHVAIRMNLEQSMLGKISHSPKKTGSCPPYLGGIGSWIPSLKIP